MSQSKIPLYNLKISKAAVREVTNTLSAGWLSSGPKVKAFEEKIAAMSGVKYSAAVNSATLGLITAMKALGVKGGEVITTPFTFVATAEAIIQCGAVPVFADIDPDSLNVDPESVRKKITRKTTCILPVDIAGIPADYKRLRILARANKLPIVADASHALGAKYNGKTIPQLADAAVYSFHATKNLTCGEGGMVLSSKKRVIDEIKLLSRHGITAAAFQRKRMAQLSYDVTRLGQKANMAEVNAAIGLGGLGSFEANQAKRRKIYEYYSKSFADLVEFVSLPATDVKVHPAWHLYIIKLRLSRLTINRDRFIRLMAERGVECGVHFVPIPEFSYYRELGYSLKDLPNTADAGRSVVTLPLYPQLRMSEVKRVCDSVRKIVSEHAR